MMEITAALSSARTLLGLAKTAVDVRDDAKLKAALAGLQDKLYDATSAALVMAQTAAALQLQLSQTQQVQRELEAKLLDRTMYRLDQLRPGAFAYRAQPDLNRPGDMEHCICQPCFDAGIKAVLQYEAGTAAWTNGHWRCPVTAEHRIDDTQAAR